MYLYECVLIVKIENRNDFDDLLSSVISVDDIDPSRVLIDMCDDGEAVFYAYGGIRCL